MRRVQLDRDELAHVPRAAQLSYGGEEAVGLAVNTEDEAVEEDEMRAVARLAQVVWAEEFPKSQTTKQASCTSRFSNDWLTILNILFSVNLSHHLSRVSNEEGR